MSISRCRPIALVTLAGAAASAAAQPAVWQDPLSGDWNDPLRWAGGVVPNGGGFDVTISAFGNPYTVNLNINASVNSFRLNSVDATFQSVNRTLTVATSADLDAGLASFTGGGFAGAGTLTNRTTFDVFGTVNISTADFIQDGIMNLIATGSLNTTLNRNGDMTNSGEINLTSTAPTAAILTVTGTLTNTASGNIVVDAGSAGTRALTTTSLENEGRVEIRSDTLLNATSGTYTNNGMFEIAVGHTATLGGSGTLTFNQDSGTLNNLGAFVSTGEVFNFNGGEILGNALDIRGGTLNNTADGQASFDLTQAVSYSGDISGNQTVDLIATVSANAAMNAASFSNSGVLTLTSTAATSSQLNTSGTFTNNADGVLNIEQGGGGTRQLTTTGFVNNGQANLNASTLLNATSGTYTNNADFNVAAGQTATFTGSGTLTFNQDSGTLNNAGEFVSTGEVFNFNGGEILGNALDIRSGTLNNTADGQASFDLTQAVSYSGDISGNQTVDLIATVSANAAMNAASFSNSGVLTLTSTAATSSQLNTSGTFTNNADGVLNIEQGGGGMRQLTTTGFVNNGQANLNASTLLNATSGTYTNNADFNVAAGQTTTFTGSGTLTFNQDSGTLNNAGEFVSTGEVFNFNGGEILGNDIQINGGNLSISTGGQGDFDLLGTVAYAGDLAGTQTLDIIATASANAVTNAASFANSGHIRLTSTVATNARLSMSGTLTNNADGMLVSAQGAGGLRQLSISELNNNGIVQIDRSTRFDATSSTFRNNATVNIASGTTLDVSGSGTLFFEQNAGVVDNQGSFVLTGERFDMNGGQITGNEVTLNGGTLNLNGGGSAAFDVFSTANVAGTIGTTQVVSVVGTSGSNAQATAVAFGNDGRFTLTSTAATNARFDAQTFNNNANGVMTIEAGAGGGRTVNVTNFNNAGFFDVQRSTGFGATSGTFSNTGTFRVGDGAEAVFAGAGTLTFINAIDGIVTGNGRIDNLDVNVFINDGTFAPGDGAGTLEYEGDWTQSTAGRLDIELMGRNAGEFDLLRVFGDVTLDGTLIVSVDGFIPSTSDTFVILDADTLTGSFANAGTTVAVVGGGSFDVLYDMDEGTVTLANYIPTPGAAIALLAAGLLAPPRRRHQI